MKSILKIIDYYSHNIALTYKGKEKYKTAFGGVLTVLTIIAVLINAWLIGNDIFYKRIPTIIASEETLATYPNYTISYDNFFISYFFSDQYNTPFYDETVLKVVPTYYQNYYDSNHTLHYTQTILDWIPCDVMFEKNQNLKAPLSKDILQPMKCINNLNHTFGGFWTESFLNYLFFSVYTCSNDTLTNGSLPCKSQEEIDQILSGMYINMFYPTMLINGKNYTDPIKTVISEDWFVMQTNLFKELDYYFENNVVNTDNGVVFNSGLDKEERLGYKQLKQDYRIKSVTDDNLIILFTFYMNNEIKTFNRTYIKLQNIFANLGGIISVITLVLKFFFAFILDKKFSLIIMNHLFDVEEIDYTHSNLSHSPKKANVMMMVNNFSKLNELKADSSLVDITTKNLQRNNFMNNSILDNNKIFQKNIDSYIKMKTRKLKYTSFQLVLSIFCPQKFLNREINTKNKLFEKAEKYISSSRDLMTLTKNSQDIVKLKYLMLNESQSKTFDYLSKPKQNGLGKNIY
jgi:hypothetical protein